MKGSEIRSMFLEYFNEKGHTRLSSSSLVPADDPSLLFTNAGMVQFKSTFLGHETRPYKRATTSQKCVRAGGKHNDLENVGFTARHHTFFEMLGNFSFGDYFKEGAISFAWEFLTERLHLDPEKLWISVHNDDDEAYDIWKDKIGVSPERIIRLGDKDNFWAMGDTGPCGPCSEIHYDQGPGVGCGRPECRCGECDCDRYLEIWNLVFMQFNRDDQGNLTPLPRPNIDTGMGLERIAAVLQGVNSNYDTDLFMPLINHIADMAGITYRQDKEKDTSIKVIADHARACAFLIADGVLPSNEGRGYVLRRIIRRAARHGKLIGFDKPFLHNASMKVIEEMKEAYPELASRKTFIDEVIINEEERFLQTLDNGLALLEEVMAGLEAKGEKTIPGKEVFKLYDTFGFPVDLTGDIASRKGFTVDNEGFEEQMEMQREMARASSGFTGASTNADVFESVPAEGFRFLGYDSLSAKANIRALFARTDDSFVPAEKLSSGQIGAVITDATPFYAESGGQIGDTGTITSTGTLATVTDTAKATGGIFVHMVKVEEGSLSSGQEVSLDVDESRRRDIMRNHSATHLLQRALRDVLGEHAHQSGSLVTESRLRFDFTHFSQMSDEEILDVETRVNDYVLADMPVNTRIMNRDEAVSMGAMALFSEKYADDVRVVTMGDDVSVELCGGTHMNATGEIGLVKILSESSVASGIRRIEAVTGRKALAHMRELDGIVSQASDRLRCTAEEVPARMEQLQTKIKEQDSKIRELGLRIATGATSAETEEKLRVADTDIIIKRIDAAVPQMREVGDRMKERLGSGMVFLVSGADDKATFMIMLTDDSSFKAGDLMKSVCAAVGGRGGGKPLFAQGGAPSADCIEKAVDAFKSAVGGK